MPERESRLPLLRNKAANANFLKAFFVLLAGALFFCIPKKYLGDTFPLCLYRILFDKQCIGCGTTRAVWSVLHLRFAEAFEYNKMIVLSFPLLSVCLLKWIIKK